MRKGLLIFLFGALAGFFSQELQAEPGDTIRVSAKDKIHWQGYGGYFTEADFPGQIGDNKSYQRIWLKATLGCPDGGCSDWDYTTKFAIYKPSNKETYLPDFKVDDSIRKSFQIKKSPVYQYVYNGNNIVDSSRVDSLRVTLHDRSPEEPVESNYYWEAGRHVYDVNQQGNVVDSHNVTPDSTWTNQVDTISGTPIEIGRAATPYSGNRGSEFSYPWYFDVTDYQDFLKSTQDLRAFYRGPRDGFTIELEFIMIEGTPPRDPVSVQNIYKSPPTGFYYGFDTSDINGDRLVPTDFTMPNEAEEAKVRVSIKGHGFGDANANCAEFCEKWYRVLVNQNQVAQNVPWRGNCDMTPVYPQTGTWILPRSNWCPGTVSKPSDHEITDQVTPGQDFTVKMNMQSHNFIEPNRNYTDPRWVIDAQLITYGEKNFTNDVAVQQIMEPSNNPRFSRFNPSCGQPRVIIENTGANTLTSAKIDYGARGSEKLTYEWEGQLGFMEADTVVLPNKKDWSELYKGLKPFEVRVYNPNGKTDEYNANNKTATEYEAVPEYPSEFRLELNMNSAPGEVSYKIQDKDGNIVYERSEFEANKTYYDEFSLDKGCYEFILTNKRGSPFGVGDGLNYFCCTGSRLCNNEGCGSANLVQIDSRRRLENGTFIGNFGHQVRRSFTVGYPANKDEAINTQKHLKLYPVPANDQLNVNLSLEEQKDVRVSILSIKGKVVKEKVVSGYKHGGFEIATANLKPGTYMMQINTGDANLTKQFVKE